jgi:hypothetical protein
MLNINFLAFSSNPNNGDSNVKSLLLTTHQRRLMFVTADEGSIAASLKSLLMRIAKIKIKNKKVISGDHKVAANEGQQR